MIPSKSYMLAVLISRENGRSSMTTVLIRILWYPGSLDRISFRYPIERKHDGKIYVYREGKSKREETFDLRDLERCLDTMRFFGPPRNGFRIEAYYQQPVTQRSWMDRYANGGHGAIHTIHCHREYNTARPSVDVVDKSFATVYLSDGKMISLRYEDSEGGSVFSEFTLFFP